MICRVQFIFFMFRLKICCQQQSWKYFFVLTTGVLPERCCRSFLVCFLQADLESVIMQVVALGLWFHDGCQEANLALVSIEGECKVIFRDVVLEPKSAHGFFSFLPLESGAFRLLLGFHYTNRNVDHLKPMALRQVAGNLWLEEDKKEQVLYLHHINSSFKFYDALRVSSGAIQSKDAIQRDFNLEDLSSIHSVARWLHPGKKAAYVALLKNGQGMMMRNDNGTWGEANGVWQFSSVDGMDLLACHFHWKGMLRDDGLPKEDWTLFQKVDAPEQSFLQKLHTDRQTFRAIGGSTPKNPNGEILPAFALKGWHIIVQFIWFSDGEE